MNVTNLPHKDEAYNMISVEQGKDGQTIRVSCKDLEKGVSHDGDWSATICELDDSGPNALCSDIHVLICKCMAAGYKQAQRDIIKALGVINQ